VDGGGEGGYRGDVSWRDIGQIGVCIPGSLGRASDVERKKARFLEDGVLGWSTMSRILWFHGEVARLSQGQHINHSNAVLRCHSFSVNMGLPMLSYTKRDEGD
jgi:hypothetical protein